MNEKEKITFRDLYFNHFPMFEENQTIFKPLWHYTSVDGLMGIIKMGEKNHKKMRFWFTESDCLNDRSEGNHILEMYKQVCADLCKENAIDKEFYNGIKDVLISAHMFIHFPVPSKEKNEHRTVMDCQPCRAYICSFSLKEDSLDMWRYYSKGSGGYGLKVDPFLFDEHISYGSSSYREDKKFSLIRSYEVIYDKQRKIEMLKKIVTDTFAAYQVFDGSKEDKLLEATRYIQYALKELQFRFKHECYSTEEEFRFVFYRPYNKPQLLKNELPIVQYRNQNGMVIPYIDITVENGNEHLEEVWISPYIKDDAAVSTTLDYLDECGFSPAIFHSQLPVR